MTQQEFADAIVCGLINHARLIPRYHKGQNIATEAFIVEQQCLEIIGLLSCAESGQKKMRQHVVRVLQGRFGAY